MVANSLVAPFGFTEAAGAVLGGRTQPTRFPVVGFLYPRRDAFTEKHQQHAGQASPALKAPDRAAPAVAQRRTPPALAGERGSDAGGRPNRRMPHRRRFPGSAAPRIAPCG
jgi:hypothetical protein